MSNEIHNIVIIKKEQRSVSNECVRSRFSNK